MDDDQRPEWCSRRKIRSMDSADGRQATEREKYPCRHDHVDRECDQTDGRRRHEVLAMDRAPTRAARAPATLPSRGAADDDRDVAAEAPDASRRRPWSADEKVADDGTPQ